MSGNAGSRPEAGREVLDLAERHGAMLCAMRHPRTGKVHLAPEDKPNLVFCGMRDGGGWEWEPVEEDEDVHPACRTCFRIGTGAPA